jgi:hypothetical protein
MCKTFWERGTCPYGKRCCFIHTENSALTGNGLKATATPFTLRTQEPVSTSKEPPKSFLDRHQPPAVRTAPITPGRIAIPATSSSDKLFDQVTNEFSLWSPSLSSPVESHAFPFPNPEYISSKQTTASIPSSPIGTRPSAAALLFLNTRDAAKPENTFARSALSAGVPTAKTPFFLDTGNLGSGFFDEDFPMTAPATRFPPSNIFSQSSSLLSPGAASPVAPPARSFSINTSGDNVFGGSPLSASFIGSNSFADVAVPGRVGTLRKFDSGMSLCVR